MAGGGNGEIPNDIRGPLGVDRGGPLRGGMRGGGTRGAAVRGRGSATGPLRGGMRNPADDDPEKQRGQGPNNWGSDWNAETRFGGSGLRNRSFERSQVCYQNG